MATRQLDQQTAAGRSRRRSPGVGPSSTAVAGTARRLQPGVARSPAASDDRLLSAEEVADIVGMTVEWVWDQSRRGAIPTVTLGRNRRYRRLAILRWLEAIESGG